MRDEAEHFLGPTYRGRRFLRVAELVDLGLVPNRQSLREWIAAGLFPKPVRMGRRVTLFLVSEIADMVAARAAERTEETNTVPPS
jgi:predicted DNA-binding transcriptional regulator AlpA